MRPEGVQAAIREAKRADRARHRFNQLDAEAAEDEWDTFLTHAGKVYTKLRAACHGHPLDWSWWKKKMDERDQDDLLLYIHKARNSDTHRLEESTRWLSPGDHFIHLKGYGVVSEHVMRKHLSPLPVRDKAGKIYNPPYRHRNRIIGYMDVLTIMWLAGIYLNELVAEANSRLR